jgi:hypothetical protein
MLVKIRQAEVKERYIQSAFIGFQMGAAGEKTFGQYLQSLGLGDKEYIPQESRSAQDIIAGAEKTLQMMRDKK